MEKAKTNRPFKASCRSVILEDEALPVLNHLFPLKPVETFADLFQLIGKNKGNAR